MNLARQFGQPKRAKMVKWDCRPHKPERTKLGQIHVINIIPMLAEAPCIAAPIDTSASFPSSALWNYAVFHMHLHLTNWGYALASFTQPSHVSQLVILMLWWCAPHTVGRISLNKFGECFQSTTHAWTSEHNSNLITLTAAPSVFATEYADIHPLPASDSSFGSDTRSAALIKSGLHIVAIPAWARQRLAILTSLECLTLYHPIYTSNEISYMMRKHGKHTCVQAP